MKKGIILLIAVVAILTGCSKDEKGSVSGRTTSYDPSAPLVKSAVEGVKLWLVDNSFKFDNVNYSVNRKAVLDSVFSGNDGSFIFDNLSSGSYAVVPVPDSMNYKFEPEGGIDGCKFIVDESGRNYEVNFSSPFPGSANASKFYVNVVITNRTGKGYIKYFRQNFVLGIPGYENLTYANDGKGYDGTSLSIGQEYGYFYLFGVLTNNYLIDAYTGVPPTGTYYTSFWVTFPDISTTPSSSSWTIDWDAKTIKKKD